MAVEGTAKFNKGAILRIILGVAIVFVVAFLLVRFISSRENSAEKVSLETGQTQNNDDGDIATSSEEAKEDPSSEESSEAAGDDEVPTGIADSDQGLPAVGMNSSIFGSVIMISTLTYIGVYTIEKKRQLQS